MIVGKNTNDTYCLSYLGKSFILYGTKQVNVNWNSSSESLYHLDF